MGRKLTELQEATEVTSGDFLDVSQDQGGSSYISKKLDFSTLATEVLSGNAASATKLAATKNINGVAFDGTADVTIPSDITPGAEGNVLTSNGTTWTSVAPTSTGDTYTNSWTKLAIQWTSEPTSQEYSGLDGEVLAYTYGATVCYRFVPTPYDSTLDKFYSTYSNPTLSGVLATRGLGF